MNFVRKRLRDISTESRDHIRAISDFLRNNSNIYLLCTSYNYSSPCYGLYLLVRSLDPEKNIYVEDLETFSLYIAPYNEGREPGILIFSSKNDLYKVARSISSLILTGHRGYLVAPEAPSELKPFLGGSFIHIELTDDDYFLLKSLYIALSSGLSYVSEKISTPRVLRLVKEIETIDNVTKDLFEKYSVEIDLLIKIFSEKFSRIDLFYTPSARIFAEEIYSYTTKKRRDIELSISRHDTLDRVFREDSKVISVYTEAEQHMISDLRRRVLFEKKRSIEIMLRTDPLISSVYFGVLAKLFIEKMNRSGVS